MCFLLSSIKVMFSWIYSEIFWVYIPFQITVIHHRVKNVRIRSYSVRMRENVDQNISEYRHFLRNVHFMTECDIHSYNLGENMPYN